MTSAVLVFILRVILAAGLYVFIFWAFYTIWQDLRQQSHSLAIQKIPPLTFRIHGEEELITKPYTVPELMIGRDPSCDVVIQHETVSGRHSRLSYHHHQWWVEDNQSTNGTFLNEERLSTPTVIITGDELRCGQVEITIMVGEKDQD